MIKATNESPYDPAIPLSGISKFKKRHTLMFIATLFTNSQDMEAYRKVHCDERIKKVWYIQ